MVKVYTHVLSALQHMNKPFWGCGHPHSTYTASNVEGGLQAIL